MSLQPLNVSAFLIPGTFGPHKNSLLHPKIKPKRLVKVHFVLCNIRHVSLIYMLQLFKGVLVQNNL